LRVGFLSASDHPSDWCSIPSFHLLSHYDLGRLSAHLGPLIATARSNSDLVIFSIHWGPNYQWIPDKKIQELGRWLIHEGVDIIHGHSSHHIQGIEIVERRNGSFGLILYGCGDFVDDYAVDEQYRNDLGALFQLNISISELSRSIQLHSLEIFPTRCSNFQVNRLNFEDNDWKWIKDKFIQLSYIGNRTWKIGQNSQLSIDISK
jgi:poly-gamma-glutamate capsule biosynthesis protein CapA/YwtB (metallophosphatase superfamily)